jgi:hypothetical protein
MTVADVVNGVRKRPELEVTSIAAPTEQLFPAVNTGDFAEFRSVSRQ